MNKLVDKYSGILATGVLLISLLSTACTKNPITNPPVEKSSHGIIPLPVQLSFSGDKITINQDFTVVRNHKFNIASSAAEELIKTSVTSFEISDAIAPGEMGLIIITDPGIKPDAYELSVSSEGIAIKASNEAGAFYAVQSLRQYFWNTNLGLKQNTIQLPCIKIIDEPKYSWRGFHLDVSRHLFTPDYLLKIIDWLAYYKFNKFHLHLSDDQGWRVESKKFPLLNEIGSWRLFDKYDSICMRKAETNPDFRIDTRFIQQHNGKTMYGGYYSHQELASIVNYANSHCIEIIPEIDMPGHLSAAIKAYPQLLCTSSTGRGTQFSYPLCPCDESVYNLVFQIWDEIADLFPSSYVHIGADEVEKSTWKESPSCSGFMKANNLLNVNELQSFFIEKLQKHLETRGKTVIAWDDITDSKMDRKLKIMYWRDWVVDAPAKAAANGNEVIFSRWDLFYFSSAYSADNLRKLLEFDITKLYPSDITGKIIGFQGCLWTEEIPSEAAFESHIFPRLQALSEVNWSSNKNWYSFNLRMASHNIYLRKNGIILLN